MTLCLKKITINSFKSLSLKLFQTDITAFQYFIVHPTLTSRFVKLEGSGWGGTTARELTVRWETALISTHPDAHVDILLVGYSERVIKYFAHKEEFLYRNFKR